MRCINTFVFVFKIVTLSFCQHNYLDYFLPKTTYDSIIMDPKSFLGYELGEWHVTHDQLTQYMYKLAEQSDRVSLIEYGRTHQHRPLIALVISSPKNLDNLETIKKAHQDLCTPNISKNVQIENLPAILYHGYTIHGNEPSGMNASILVAYYLAAAQDEYINELLENTVILIDPCLNPDGAQKFSTWVNGHKSKTLNPDPATREFNEVWPGSRYNHYWFDLNRDWLPLVHPESKARIEFFQQWKPNVLTDHHEMGTNSTFFFQPGIPSRNNPNTPARNQELTEKIGKFHAKALDSIGSLYYTKYSFDDFYYGKGSTYPDAQGSIGILFEQASSRGHQQESVNGIINFAFTIRNQVVTSLSTQKAVLTLRKELLEYKADFYKNAHSEADLSKVKGWIFSDDDPVKLNTFLSLLNMHKVDVFVNKSDITLGGNLYVKEKSYIVPYKQNQPILAKTIFEKVTSFQDSAFYDVSTWTMPLAYGIKYHELDKVFWKKSDELGFLPKIKGELIIQGKESYAYIFNINQMNSHKILYHILSKGLRVKVLNQSLQVDINKKKNVFLRGTVVVHTSSQNMEKSELDILMRDLAEQNNVIIYSLDSGNGVEDIALGHPEISIVDKPSVAMLVGDGVSLSAGEIWFHCDHHLDMPVTHLDIHRLRNVNLDRYNTLIIASGNYNRLGDIELNKIKEWLKNKNTLILIKDAVNWAASQKLIQLKEKVNANKEVHVGHPSYGQIKAINDAKVIGGSIFKVSIDTLHPLFYGYQTDEIFLMHYGSRFYETTTNVFATPARYSADFLASGYLPKTSSALIKNAPVVTVHGYGSGRIVAIHDNPLFRGFWYGGHVLFNNALFFGGQIRQDSLEK